jgi:hypothetical protein
MTAFEGNTEAVIVGADHVGGTVGKDLDPIASHLVAADGDELGRRHSFVSEIAVYMCGRSVSRLIGVDDDDRATLTAELEGGGETRGRSPDYRDVAMTLHRVEVVFIHVG